MSITIYLCYQNGDTVARSEVMFVYANNVNNNVNNNKTAFSANNRV